MVRVSTPPALAAAVTLYDNFSSGREWHYADHVGDAPIAAMRDSIVATAPAVAYEAVSASFPSKRAT